MKKLFSVIASVVTMLLVIVSPTFAHVVVKPNQAGVAAFQTFTMGVPNEKDNPTVALRLVIPEGLKYVSPNVKPGWTIEVKKTGEGEDAKVTEISWTGGSIPVGQRDDFFFSAQVPAKETTVSWKAYQTYQNGSVVSWDQDPSTMKDMSDEMKEEHEKKGLGPYSQTKIVNDLTAPTNSMGVSTNAQPSTSGMNPDLAGKVNILMLLSGAALILSIAAMYMQWKKK